MKPLALILLTLLLLAATMGLAESSRPNIVILYADDMGFGDLACQNPESKIPTPHLDRLAREGMRFTDGHSSSGICTPSRYALLTGRFQWRKFHDIVNSFDPPVVAEEEWTLPEMLKSQVATNQAAGSDRREACQARSRSCRHPAEISSPRKRLCDP
jgi:arylsulfatase A